MVKGEKRTLDYAAARSQPRDRSFVFACVLNGLSGAIGVFVGWMVLRGASHGGVANYDQLASICFGVPLCFVQVVLCLWSISTAGKTTPRGRWRREDRRGVVFTAICPLLIPVIAAAISAI